MEGVLQTEEEKMARDVGAWLEQMGLGEYAEAE